MKVLMQNCVTRRFLGEGNARDFGSSPNAVAYYVSNPQLNDVQIVLHFDYDPRLNIKLTLSHMLQRETVGQGAMIHTPAFSYLDSD